MAGLIKAATLMILVIAASQMSACTSRSTTVDTLAITPVSGSGPADFSKPLTAAMAQMSDEEATQMSAELAALHQGRQDGTISEADYWARVREMEALAKTHSAKTLSQIETPQ